MGSFRNIFSAGKPGEGFRWFPVNFNARIPADSPDVLVPLEVHGCTAAPAQRGRHALRAAPATQATRSGGLILQSSQDQS